GALGVPDSAFILGKGMDFIIPAVVILVTGCVFAMWLGEKITDKGIGNGISLLIMIGIIATMPQSFVQEFVSRTTNNTGGIMFMLIELIIWFLVILASVRSEEHTSELQSRENLVCRLLLEKKNYMILSL